MRRDSKIRRYRRLRYLLAIDLLEFVNYTERFLLVHLEDIRHELKHNKCLISNVRPFSISSTSAEATWRKKATSEYQLLARGLKLLRCPLCRRSAALRSATL